MTFVESIGTCFKKYADFSACASRAEYWWWMLFYVIVIVAGQLLGTAAHILVALATLLPCLAVTARRLHDTDRSGWWQLIGVIPLIGTILMIVWCCQDSKRPNRYSAEPPSPLSLEKA